MTAAAVVGSGTAISVSTIAWLLYAGLSIGTYRGWLPPSSNTSPEGLSATVLLYKLAVHLVGFYGVAILSSRLTRGVGQLEQELEEKSEHIAELELRHRDIIHSVPSGLLTTDLEGTITTVNRAGLEILGLESDALEGRRIQESGTLSIERWDHLRADPQLKLSPPERNELDWVRGDEIRHIGYSLTPLTSSEDQPAGWVLVFQDLTRWRALEEQFRLKDRMAAVGELAAGIAHELGNPLAAISGSVQMLSKSVDEESPRARLLDIIHKESQRLDRTIKGFLQFARPRERSIIEFDVCRLLEENLELLRNSKEVSRDHRLELDLHPKNALITADPDQISQLFWNLSRNALRAMPGGGTLKVSGHLSANTFALSFQDTGRGMTDDERRRMFHPFQTGFVQGTGIGLSIVYRIVEEHSGRLEVESTPGQGTTISVRLPARLNALSSVPVGA
jgi:two-component system sensor histidine kinase PilS (NtrC family)